jgi:hypothetical protein
MSFLQKTKYELPILTAPQVCIFVFTKIVLLEVVYSLKIYQHTKLNGPTLIDASFSSISEV